MKRAIILAVFVFCSGLIFSQVNSNFPEFKKEVFSNSGKETLPYRLLYPKNYQKDRKYPLVLFLHGAGSQGDDNETQLGEIPQMLINAADGEQYSCFVLAPQCPKTDAWVWFPQYPLCTSAKEPSKATRLTLELIDVLNEKLKIDRDRIYVTGLSLGGEGTFDIITRRTHFFAAAVPVCGIADSGKAELMKSTPLWIFHGEQDDINSADYSRNVVKALNKLGVSPIYTEYKGVKHDSWTRAYQEPELLKWMFGKKLQK